MTILNWLEYNLQRDPSDNGITLQEILSKCNKDRFNCGLTLVDRRRLGRLVIKYFQIGISTKVMPNNILYSLKWRNHIRVIPFNIGNDTSFIKETGWRVDSTTEHALILAKVIDLKINNLNVEEKVEFRGDRWSLKINDRQVNLNDIDVDDRYITSQDGILTVLAVVDHISVCRGKELKVKFANNSIQNANLENINNTPKIVVNSTECLIAVPITCGGDTCPACKTVVENVKFLPHVPEKSSSECGIASDKSIADIKEEHNYANERSTDSDHDQHEENSNQTVEQTHKVMASILKNMDSPMQPIVKEMHSTLSETLSSKKQSGKVKSSAINDKAIITTQKTAERMTKNVQRIIKEQSHPEKNIFIPPELPNIDHVLIPVSNVDHILVPVSTKNTEERIETMQQSKDHQSQSKHEEQYGLVNYVQGVPILKHGGVLPGKEQDSFCDVVIKDTELQPSSEQYIESLIQNILMNEGDDNDGTVQHIKDDDKVTQHIKDDDKATQLDNVFSDTNMDKDDRNIHADYEDVKPYLDHELLSDAQSQATSKAQDKESQLQNILMHEGNDNDGTVLHHDTVTQIESVSRDTNVDKDDRDIHANYEDVKPYLDHELLSGAQRQATSKAPDTELYKVYCFGQNSLTPFGKVPDKRPGQIMQGSKTFCNLCNKNFRTIQIFQKHKQKFKHFKCDICTSSFMQEIDLMGHLMSSHKINVKCGLCNKKLKSVFVMRNHLKRFLHFKCTLCSKSFETNKQLAIHSMKHSLKPYTCSQCGQLFTHEEDLNTHFNSTHRLTCERCSEVYTSRQDLRTHIRSSHEERQDLRTHIKSSHEEKQFVCTYCTKCLASKSSLKVHLRIHTGERPYQCDVCSKTCISKNRLYNHKMRSHMGKTFICADCNRAFSTIYRLNLHRRRHTGEKLIQCQYCPKKFLTTQQLENHIRVHTKERPFMCEYCSKCFAQKYNLTTHRRRVHLREKPYKCEECLKRFTQKSELKSHMKIHRNTGEKPYKCEECSKCFSWLKSLYLHNKKIHSDEKLFKCEQCLKQFALKDHLKRHMRLHTKEFQCEQCSKCFEHESSLVVHRRLHTGEKPYKCEHCLKCFRLPKILYLHNKRMHSDEKSFKCEQCLKQFALKDRLKRHMRLHTKEFQCEHCSKCFTCTKNLYLHKRVHINEKLFKCEHCPSQFRLKTSLRKHLAMHTGKYKCKVCLKCFEMKKELLLHAKTHFEEKVIKRSVEKKKVTCEHCSKVFSQRHCLLKHLSIHTGEKPFQCEFCSRFFRQLFTLKVHRRIHTGEKPFKCEYCSKSFRERVQLRNHRRIHTGEKPFKCEFCSKCFRVKASLRIHRKTHTGENFAEVMNVFNKNPS